MAEGLRIHHRLKHLIRRRPRLHYASVLCTVHPQMTTGLSSMGVASQSLEGVADDGCARESPGSPRQHGVASRFNVRSARNSFRRPEIHPRAVGKLTSVTICRELRHSDQTIKSEHVGTDRRRKTDTFARRIFCTPNDPPACPAWGWGRKALRAQPPSAARGRSPGSPRQHGVASRFNVRTPAIHSGARKFIPEQSENLHLSRSAANEDIPIKQLSPNTLGQIDGGKTATFCARENLLHPQMTTRPVQQGLGSQSLEGVAVDGCALQSRDTAPHGVASRFNVGAPAIHSGARKFVPDAVGKVTSVTICRELRHSDQTIKSEHVGTDRRREKQTTFCARARVLLNASR